MQTPSQLLRRTAGATAVAVALAAALSAPPLLAQQTQQKHTPLEDPIPGLIKPAPVKVSLAPVLSGLVSPVTTAVAPGDAAHMYVLDQVGQVWRLPVRTGLNQRPEPELFLDVSRLLVKLGIPPSNYDERGLLGLAFHPDYRTNGLFYTFTSQPVRRKADFSTVPRGVAPNCQSVVTEWRIKRPGYPDSGVDLRSARELLRIDKPQFNHNGGTLLFGPDHMLYISLGDGGFADDQGPGHAPQGNGQTLAPGNVLGKILRIDPLGRNSANGRYGVPPDNPFVRKQGADEIYAYGFRNPYRMSFDPTGRLVVADVGQNDIEEVDVVTAGGNFGWRIKEGTFLFDPDGPNSLTNEEVGKGFVYADSPGLPAGLTDPIAEYDHTDKAGAPEVREAIIGGFVYRGAAIPSLRGHYVFGDYTGAKPGTGHMFMLGARDEVQELVATNRNPLKRAVLGFGQDPAGELYLLSNSQGTLTGKTGTVMKIVGSRGSER